MFRKNWPRLFDTSARQRIEYEKKWNLLRIFCGPKHLYFLRRGRISRGQRQRKFSADIHREIGHITGAINLLADSLEKDIRSSNLEAALDSCQKFKSIFHDFFFNLRKLALDLRPPDLSAN